MADKKISELDATFSLNGSYELPVALSGDNFKLTLSQIASYVSFTNPFPIYVVKLRAQTTDATATPATVYGGAIAGYNVIVVGDGYKAMLRISISASVSAGDYFFGTMDAAVGVDAGVATIYGSPTITTVAATTAGALWTKTLTGTNTYEGFYFMVTGDAATTIDWRFFCEIYDPTA